MNNFKLQLFLFIICSKVYVSICFFLPVSTPINYCEEGKINDTCQSHIPLYVSRLYSERNFIPYEYNHFDFCAADESEIPVENVVQVMFDERVKPSPYNIKFKKNVNCALLCQKTYNLKNADDIAKMDTLKKGILDNYEHYWVFDSMPVSWCYEVVGAVQFCSTGFPMGCYVNYDSHRQNACVMNTKYNKPDTFYFFNHVDLMIFYRSEEESSGVGFKNKGDRIIRIKVQPRSLKNQLENSCSADSLPMDIPNDLKANVLTINYTYSVTFLIDNTVKWSSRWDYILESSAPHKDALWFSVLNSLVVGLFLTGMAAMILFHKLRKDMAHFNQIQYVSTLKSPIKVGWMCLDGDVFRTPHKGMLLSILIGSGIQVFFTALITLFFAYFVFLPPAYRGSLVTCAMIFYVCLGFSAGYVSATFYKAFGGVRWKLNGMLTSTLCPGCIFFFFFVMNLIFWTEGSSSTKSFTTLLALLSFWFGMSFLITFGGAYFGFKSITIEHPVQSNQIPREIPKQPFYIKSILGIIIGGILPFSCIFVQLFFILNSIWFNQVYYMFGILIFVFALLVITCSETSLLLCYFHLNAEDYHWWWRSFLTSGFAGFYLFAYCIYFFSTKLNVSDAASTFLYFYYALLMAFLFFLLTGTVGFFACFWFVRKIYGVKKAIPSENQKRKDGYTLIKY